MSIRSTISVTFEEVAAEQRCKLSVLTDDTQLLQSGLNSLGFALVVARLEETLGIDPFASLDVFPTTFGEFVTLYESQPK